jgi:ParB-like chromosome segregation protein Spo0J
MSETTIGHVGQLVPDPNNARRHTPRNIGTIVESLQAVGAGRSIVIDETDTVLAGNGTIEAAAEAGITRLKIVEADGNEIVAVRRRGLTPDQKRRLALGDNRSAELAEWDDDVLRDQLRAIEAEGASLFALGWNETELQKIFEAAAPPAETAADEPAADADGVGGAKLTFSAGQWQLVAEGLDAARPAVADAKAKDSAVLVWIVQDWLASRAGVVDDAAEG